MENPTALITLEYAGIVEKPNGNYTYANDFVHEGDEPLEEAMNALAQKYGIVGKVLQEHGPQGWPYIEWEGTPNAMRIFVAYYDQDPRLLQAGL